MENVGVIITTTVGRQRNKVEDDPMQALKQVLQHHTAFGGQSGTQFSWNLAAQRTVLAAAFIFVAVLVLGAI
jgi:hypothetical protein